MATAGILHHIMQLSPQTIFTTREMLQYGRRGAVDQCLHTMVKSRFIFRLAQGVFVRDASIVPSVEEIARIKARAFGKRICDDATNVLQEIGVTCVELEAPTEAERVPKTKYSINGHSSSFRCIHGIVEFRGVAQRKARLSETKLGRRMFALWHLGNHRLTAKALVYQFRELNKSDREELRQGSAWMPAWLNDMCIDRHARVIAIAATVAA
jgi:hypothetical protein